VSFWSRQSPRSSILQELDEVDATLPHGRSRAGRLLLMSAALMLVAAALCATGVLGVSGSTQYMITGALAVSGVVEGLIGLRFLSES
jgi:hypothetical protein